MNLKQETFRSKHNYTSKELTGLTATEQKEKAILQKLFNYYYKSEEGYEYKAIKRYNLRLLIAEAFQRPLDRLTFFKHVDFLLALKFLTQNPTTHLTPNNHILPDNDTKYLLEIDAINESLHELNVKEAKFLKGKNILSVPNLDFFSQSENVESQSHETKLSNNTH